MATHSDSLGALTAIAEERRGYILRMKEALTSGDNKQLVIYARRLCGLSPIPTKSEVQYHGKKKKTN